MSVPLGCMGRGGRCSALAARVEGDVLVIIHVHRGERHETRVRLSDLQRLTAQERILISV